MNKTELVSVIVARTALPKKKATAVIDSLTEAITETLAVGGTVCLVGFGTFSVRKRAARAGRNPASGTEIRIPETKVPKFRAGKMLRETVNRPEKRADRKTDNVLRFGKYGRFRRN